MDTEALRKNLPELRIRKGWSQGDLGRRADVRADTVSSIERGKHAPRPSTLRKLADALGVEVEDFFREPKSPKGPAPKSLDDLRGFLEAQLGSSWLALPDDEWSNWWRNVSKEVAARRLQQIRAEGNLIRDEWMATREGRSAFAPGGYPQWGGLYSRTFARKFSAPFFAPQQDESEEDFRKRSAKGRAIDRYYQDIFQEQRQDVQQVIEEEERYREAA